MELRTIMDTIERPLLFAVKPKNVSIHITLKLMVLTAMRNMKDIHLV